MDHHSGLVAVGVCLARSIAARSACLPPRCTTFLRPRAPMVPTNMLSKTLRRKCERAQWNQMPSRSLSLNCAVDDSNRGGPALEDPPSIQQGLMDPDAEQADEKQNGIMSWLYPSKEDLPNYMEMSIFDHLEELRQRVFVSVAIVGVAIVGCFAFAKALLEAPAYSQGVRFLQLSPGEYFFTTLKVPIIQLLLGQTRIVTGDQMLSVWRYVVVGAVIGAAVLTPSTDPLTQVLLAGPLIALYLSGAFLIKVLQPQGDQY